MYKQMYVRILHMKHHLYTHINQVSTKHYIFIRIYRYVLYLYGKWNFCRLMTKAVREKRIFFMFFLQHFPPKMHVSWYWKINKLLWKLFPFFQFFFYNLKINIASLLNTIHFVFLYFFYFFCVNNYKYNIEKENIVVV